MPAAIFPARVSVVRPASIDPSQLCSTLFVSGHHLFLSSTTTGEALRPSSPSLFLIRMGGGPRTYPGGVSRRQWKRMQAEKAKQLLRARCLRRRQQDEMLRRAELEAASEPERPWQVVERACATSLFCGVSADEQVQAQRSRPGVPQVFRLTPEGLPSARFFPKGVVHSVKPYGIVDLGEPEVDSDDNDQVFDEMTSGQMEPNHVEVETFDEVGKLGYANPKFSNGANRHRGEAPVDGKVSTEEGLAMDSREEGIGAMRSGTTNELERRFRCDNKKMGNGMKNSGNGRSKIEKMWFEPTIELYSKAGIYQERGFMPDGDDGFK